MLDVPDRRPVEDLLWLDTDYQALHRAAGLDQLIRHQPLGRPDDPVSWTTEARLSPWSIYVLRAADAAEVS